MNRLPFRGLIPLLSVKSVPASIEFYERLGFQVAKTHTPEGGTDPVWASLTSNRAELMLGQAEHPVQPTEGLFFYLYVDDIPAKHAELSAAGIEVQTIEYPFWSPRGEFCLKDPDGYDLVISHT
jgi:catechol 2,3-dioxygenase-like lactoylglutathione lyase family enzyme